MGENLLSFPTPNSLLPTAIGYNGLRRLGLWLSWIEQAPPEKSGTVEETP